MAPPRGGDQGTQVSDGIFQSYLQIMTETVFLYFIHMGTNDLPSMKYNVFLTEQVHLQTLPDRIFDYVHLLSRRYM